MTRTETFARLLRAEWTKLRTVRGWVLAVAGAALATVRDPPGRAAHRPVDRPGRPRGVDGGGAARRRPAGAAP
ncbi:hypothetical protein [Streptomyces sp. NPDC051183]|uniref:hypothetical protein n=1 Tax=unclassified Streptomyces TaxID=2593676 RepID=UPI00344ABB27